VEKDNHDLRLQIRNMKECIGGLTRGKLTSHKHVGTVYQMKERVGRSKKNHWWLGYVLCHTAHKTGNRFTIIFQDTSCCMLNENDLETALGVEEEAECVVCQNKTSEPNDCAVMCSTCSKWWHIGCHIPNVTVEDLKAPDWFCAECRCNTDGSNEEADAEVETVLRACGLTEEDEPDLGEGFPDSQLGTE